MTEDQFWRLIDESRRDFNPAVADGNMDRQEARLRELLIQLPIEEVQGFATILSDLLNRSYRWDLWGAAYVLASGCSDDGFDYFRTG